jgi:hypothetical protein
MPLPIRSVRPGTIGWPTLALAIASLTFWYANGQPAQPKKSPPIPPSRVQPNPAPELTVIENRLAAIEQTLSRTNIDARLAEIQAAVNKLSPPSLLTTLMPALIAALAGLTGVFIGSIGNERLQKARLGQEAILANSKAQQERELSEKQAKLQIGSAVIDWKLKQLSLLYGPLRALLGQSLGLYREMNEALVAAHADKFRFIESGTDPDKKQFQIQTSPGNWTRFRTVIHIFEVYGHGFGVETYFDEIVSIGAQMVKIIQEHAGYARAQEKDLMGVFGKYLAHFAVLKAVHEAAKAKAAAEKAAGTGEPSTFAPPLQVNLSAVFPEVIHTLINQGFDALTADIEQWHQKAVA